MNPIEEVQPTIAELFSRDPLHITDNDLDRIIVLLREKYITFAAEDEEARRQGRRVNPSKGVTAEELGL